MVIDNRYELQERIGAGRFGVCTTRGAHARDRDRREDLEERHRRRHRVLSIDSIEHLQGKPPSLEAAEFPPRGRARLPRATPNAVRVFDFGVLPSGLAYLCMELLRGENLDDELREKGRLSVARAVEVLIPVCACLAAAHEGNVIHRDIKPANVFLHRPSADVEVVKVLDFGVAKLLDTSAEATRDAIAGSPAYMAPERLRGRRYDGRSDVYAVGIMLYELLTGEVPFRSENPDIMAVALMQLRETAVPPTQVVDELPPVADTRCGASPRERSREAAQRPGGDRALAGSARRRILTCDNAPVRHVPPLLLCAVALAAPWAASCAGAGSECAVSVDCGPGSICVDGACVLDPAGGTGEGEGEGSTGEGEGEGEGSIGEGEGEGEGSTGEGEGEGEGDVCDTFTGATVAAFANKTTRSTAPPRWSRSSTARTASSAPTA